MGEVGLADGAVLTAVVAECQALWAGRSVRFCSTCGVSGGVTSVVGSPPASAGSLQTYVIPTPPALKTQKL